MALALSAFLFAVLVTLIPIIQAHYANKDIAEVVRRLQEEE